MMLVVNEECKYYDFFFKNYIFIDLEDDLYNIFNLCKTSNELRDALENKYKTKDVGWKSLWLQFGL